jgi:hypothetical protein
MVHNPADFDNKNLQGCEPLTGLISKSAGL